MQINILSLFSGAGGLDLGFRTAGFKPVLALDVSASAIRTYNFNAKTRIAKACDLGTTPPLEIARLVDDALDGQQLHGVIGGPPCQGFSTGNTVRRVRDPRNSLAYRYAELMSTLAARHPLKFFVFENVPGLAQPRNARRLSRIKGAFRSAGFNVHTSVLNALNFDVPQKRRRVFLVGTAAQAGLEADNGFSFPSGKAGPSPVPADVLKHLPDPAFFDRSLTSTQIPFHANHWTMQPRSKRFGDGQVSATGRSFKQVAWDAPSPTIAFGNREIHIHPDGNRRLSIYEAMLLQGFPPTYRLMGNLSEQVKLVSNAVPPPMAAELARAIRVQLFGKKLNRGRLL